jgi:hypothetical protein
MAKATMPDRDYLEGLDGLQSDMANHQRIVGAEVTARENRDLAVSAIERLEKEDAEAKAPAPAGSVSAPVTPETVTRTIEDRTYIREREPDKTPMFRTATEFEHQVLRHAQPRLALLMGEVETGILGSPSWRSRTLAAMYFKVKSLEARKSGQFGLADNYERAYQVDLQELLEASNQPFGDWRKDPETKLVIG